VNNKIKVIYQDKDITITRDFVRLAGHSYRETIPVGSISNARVTSLEIGNYRTAAPLLVLIGLISLVFFFMGFIFIALGIGAWFTKIYRHTLIAKVDGSGYTLIPSGPRGRLRSIASTINGLALSKKLTAVTS
jgi:hypothetical protein